MAKVIARINMIPKVMKNLISKLLPKCNSTPATTTFQKTNLAT